jgi:hypothetical protein
MTGNELKILQDWQDERHREMIDRFNGLDSRLDKIEELPRLTPDEIIKIRIAAMRLDRAAGVLRLITPKKVAAASALPGIGTLIFVVDKVRDVIP